MIEEGLSIEDLARVVLSMHDAARDAGVGNGTPATPSDGLEVVG